MKILVTGAAGFIGSHFAEAARQKGHDVTGIDNFSDYYDPQLKETTAAELAGAGISIIRADLADLPTYTSLPNDFDFIFHFAAQPGISAAVPFSDYLRNNVIATGHLLDFAQMNKALRLFVNISTSSVYGSDATGDELTIPKPFSFYGVTKLAAEQLALSYARNGVFPACSLRLFSVYGPRERPDKLYTKLIACLANDTSFPLFAGSEKHVRSFTYVADIVAGILTTIERADICNGSIFNIGTDEEHSTQEGIETAERLFGKKVQLSVLPARPGDQLRTKAEIGKARELLAYAPQTSLAAGLQAQIDWYRAHFPVTSI